MDTVFEGLIAMDILCVLVIVFMVYNRIRWKDELHGLFGYRPDQDREDAG
ncbi:MAG: hypothetical protein JSU01_03460 [Bacteroidetes bacterium]|nr:hypothetical protein [Bacteroidota bacterium]